ncbi:MAG: pseudaminic acid biosynthesis-associated methylase [Peptococcaceae bacterium BICA1-7]|nr:MAG: pseudaminic acid biosynthesis-associated methylase [Peptococcaceae bacterium BICA1-7]HBV96584.1 pseudaminic acid biosynthesis-associated methylase [Desulfotomaculum sp.]
MSGFKTEQESFWAGSFGDEYVERNRNEQIQAGKLAFFGKLFSRMSGVSSCIELGSNIGLNLRAINQLLPGAELAAVEINEKAVSELNKWGKARVYHQSILKFTPECTYDLAFTVGVLIHLNPDMLPKVYDVLYKSSKKYIMVAEYYNPTPMEVNYRGHAGKLFKRDFAGEIMDRHNDLELVDYGFLYRRDNNFPMDDATWFLMKKTNIKE